MSNSLDLDQARHLVGPGLGPNCLQRLSADDTSGQRFTCNLTSNSSVNRFLCKNNLLYINLQINSQLKGKLIVLLNLDLTQHAGKFRLFFFRPPLI